MTDPAALARAAVDGCLHTDPEMVDTSDPLNFVPGACAPCIEAAIRAGQRAVLDLPPEEAGRLLFEASDYGSLSRKWETAGSGHRDHAIQTAARFLAALRARVKV